MNYYTAMMQSFEKEKNKRAGLITGGVALAMLLTFIFLKWPLPVIEFPPQDMYIEVAAFTIASTFTLVISPFINSIFPCIISKNKNATLLNKMASHN